jgi:hypothetical protein
MVPSYTPPGIIKQMKWGLAQTGMCGPEKSGLAVEKFSKKGFNKSKPAGKLTM